MALKFTVVCYNGLFHFLPTIRTKTNKKVALYSGNVRRLFVYIFISIFMFTILLHSIWPVLIRKSKYLELDWIFCCAIAAVVASSAIANILS